MLFNTYGSLGINNCFVKLTKLQDVPYPSGRLPAMYLLIIG